MALPCTRRFNIMLHNGIGRHINARDSALMKGKQLRCTPAIAMPAMMMTVYEVPSTTPMGRCGIWSVMASNSSWSTVRASFPSLLAACCCCFEPFPALGSGVAAAVSGLTAKAA